MEVPQSYQAEIGDVLDFHYTVKGWGKEGQILSLVHKLDEDQRWEVKEYDWDEEKSKLRIRVKVLKNPLPLIIIAAAIGAIGLGLFCWLSLDKVEKIIASPVGGLTMLGVVLGGIMALRAFAK